MIVLMIILENTYTLIKNIFINKKIKFEEIYENEFEDNNTILDSIILFITRKLI